jgi:hypothetical protein
MGFLTNYNTLPDSAVLSSSQTIRIHIAVNCPSLLSGVISPLTTQDVSDALNGITDFNVDNVQYDTSGNIANLLNWNGHAYLVDVTPTDGLQVGDLRNEVYTLLTSFNQARVNSCNQVTVGSIETAVPFSLNPFSGSASGAAVGFGGLALLALVVLGVIFLVKE